MDNWYSDMTMELIQEQEAEERIDDAIASEGEIEMLILQYQEMCEANEVNKEYIIDQGYKALIKALENSYFNSDYQNEIYDKLYEIIEELRKDNQ